MFPTYILALAGPLNGFWMGEMLRLCFSLVYLLCIRALMVFSLYTAACLKMQPLSLSLSSLFLISISSIVIKCLRFSACSFSARAFQRFISSLALLSNSQ